LFRSLRVEANVMFVENKALHQWFSKIKRFDTIKRHLKPLNFKYYYLDFSTR